MLALAMSLLARPRLLIIDELSLGLAPVIVSPAGRDRPRCRRSGTTILLVEQSVNVALTMASTAYFMERGRIRFSGPAEELLARPDLLRAVFLAGGESGDGRRDRSGTTDRRPVEPTSAVASRQPRATGNRLRRRHSSS